MPLFKLNDAPDTPHYAIWRIEEPESFFVERLGFSAFQKLPRRRLEFLASRFLLQYLRPRFPFADVSVAPPGKPFFSDRRYHFSISHSFPYVAVAVDRLPIGIDVQIYQDKILRLKNKFLSAEEQDIIGTGKERLTIGWAAKEAAYKWFGDGGMDFIHHLPIRSFVLEHRRFARLDIEFRRQPGKHLLAAIGGMETDFAWSLICQ